MVQDILTGFVPGPWLADLDFSTLQKYPGNFISDQDQSVERRSDQIWRVRCKGDWVYVYLLFEFQSTIDPWMAVRMLVYMGLLYQDLITGKELTEDGKLPFVLPIVLYNGGPRWNAAISTDALIHPAPPGFANFVPHLSYYLLDEGSFDETMLKNQNNLAAMIFLIENQTSVDGLHQALAKVLQLAESGKQETLFKAIAQLAQRVWKKNLPGGVPMPDGIVDLKGVVSMLAENVEKMVAVSEQHGRQQGMQQGMQQGIQQGMQQGMQQGSATMLQAMLASRFGPLPDWAMEKIAAASAEQLARWGVALLAAKTIGEVFS
jgi:hypothetical protein